MTAPLKINDENAEFIGKPIFDKILQSFKNADREEFLQHFPYLRDWMTEEIFTETAGVLNRLGDVASLEYSDRSIKENYHVLAWNVQYTNDVCPVRWGLFLDEKQGEVIVAGFAFDR